jgi:hypothetical protein
VVLLWIRAPPEKGMYSMNRTVKGFSFVSSTKSRTSESFNPRTTTAFSLTDASPRDSSATSRVRITASCPVLRVISWNFSGSNVSRLKCGFRDTVTASCGALPEVEVGQAVLDELGEAPVKGKAVAGHPYDIET